MEIYFSIYSWGEHWGVLLVCSKMGVCWYSVLCVWFFFPSLSLISPFFPLCWSNPAAIVLLCVWRSRTGLCYTCLGMLHSESIRFISMYNSTELKRDLLWCACSAPLLPCAGYPCAALFLGTSEAAGCLYLEKEMIFCKVPKWSDDRDRSLI